MDLQKINPSIAKMINGNVRSASERWAKRFFVLLISGSASAHHIAADDAAAQATGNSALEQYEGVYRFGAYRELVVTVLHMGTNSVLMTADLQSDAIRILGPQGQPDTFSSGPTFARATPIRSLIHFARDEGGAVSGLSRQLVDSSGRRSSAELAKTVAHRTQPVRFQNGDVKLDGSLMLPAGKGPFPAVIFAHGSEGSDRHSFGPTPLALVAHGFAALIYDKRGTGTSTGNWQNVGIEPLGDDLLAALRFIRRQRAIDPRRVGVFGTSEGGWVAAYAAARDRDLAFVVTVSGGALTKADAYLHKVRKQAELMSSARRDSAIQDAVSLVDSSRARVLRHNATGFDLRISYDPTSDWRKFGGSALHLEGESDVLEPGPAAAAWYVNLHRAAGHHDATVKLFPKAHHSLIQAVEGTTTEFETAVGLTQMATGYWDSLFRWLAEHAQEKSNEAERRH